MQNLIIDTGADEPILNALLSMQASAQRDHKLVIITSDSKRLEQLKARFEFYSTIQIQLLKESDEAVTKLPPLNPNVKPSPDGFLIVSAANGRFRWWYNQLAFSAAQFNYPIEIYDLGGLGFGKAHVSEVQLNDEGYYTVIGKNWKSKALHKPDIIADCLNRFPVQTVYLDADIAISKPISEVFDPAHGDYDIGITVRSDRELQNYDKKDNQKITGYINAGVVFFRNTPGAKKFIKLWQNLTLELNNDQLALNQLVNPDGSKLVAHEKIHAKDYTVRLFDGAIYNYDYQIGNVLSGAEKLFHFKNSKDRMHDFDESRSAQKDSSFLDYLISKIPPQIEVYDPLMLELKELREEAQRLRVGYHQLRNERLGIKKKMGQDRIRYEKRIARVNLLVDRLKKFVS